MSTPLPFQVVPYNLSWRVQSAFARQGGGSMFTSKAMSLIAAERLRDRMNFAYRCGEKRL